MHFTPVETNIIITKIEKVLENGNKVLTASTCNENGKAISTFPFTMFASASAGNLVPNQPCKVRIIISAELYKQNVQLKFNITKVISDKAENVNITTEKKEPSIVIAESTQDEVPF